MKDADDASSAACSDGTCADSDCALAGACSFRYIYCKNLSPPGPPCSPTTSKMFINAATHNSIAQNIRCARALATHPIVPRVPRVPAHQ